MNGLLLLLGVEEHGVLVGDFEGTDGCVFLVELLLLFGRLLHALKFVVLIEFVMDGVGVDVLLLVRRGSCSKELALGVLRVDLRDQVFNLGLTCSTLFKTYCPTRILLLIFVKVILHGRLVCN